MLPDSEDDDLPFGSRAEKDPLILFNGEMTFCEAVQLLAASPSQWEKITNPNERHFCGNWAANTLLEIAVRYLCYCHDWHKFKNEFSIPLAVYDELHGNIAATAYFGLPLVSRFCLEHTAGGYGHFYFDTLTEAAHKCFGNEDEAVSEAFNKVRGSNYFTITEDELALLQKEAQRPPKIDATWLLILLNLADKIEPTTYPPKPNNKLIITPSEVYIEHMDYVINEIAALTKEDLYSIFPHWSEAEAEINTQVTASLVGSIQFAQNLTSERILKHESNLIKSLLDFLRHHLKNEKPQIRMLTYVNLRKTLGIICCEVILPSTTEVRTTHRATVNQCIDPVDNSKFHTLY